MEAAANITTALTKMGIIDLFDENMADLSGISGRNDLFVSDLCSIKLSSKLTKEEAKQQQLQQVSLIYFYFSLMFLDVK